MLFEAGWLRAGSAWLAGVSAFRARVYSAPSVANLSPAPAGVSVKE
jgi:hypothetical protein